MKKTEIKYLLLLIIAAMLWGSTFVAQSTAMDHIEPFTFLALRNYIGALFLTPIIPILDRINKSNAETQNNKNNTRLYAIGGLCAGMALTLAAGLQQVGIQYTTVGKAGFLTAMYIIFVPFITLIVFRKKLPRKIWFCVLLSAIGMAFLCLRGSLYPELGDLLELLCALAYSVHILILDFFTEKLDPVRLSRIQFLVCGVISTVIMFLFEQPSISLICAAWLPILYAGIMSSGIAYTLQAVAQKNCDPTLASLVMCMESVFSVLSGWLILNETMSSRELIGCTLMFAAIVLANLPSKKNQCT